MLFCEQSSFGIGAIYVSDRYVHKKEKIIPIPMIYYDNDKIYIKGLEAGVRINQYISVIVQPRFDGFDDNVHLQRDSTVDGGVSFEYPIERFKLNGKFLSDLYGIHKGNELSLKVSKSFTSDTFHIISPFIGIEYQDQSLTNYYYGDGQYKPNGALNAFFGVVGVYFINENYTFNYILKDTKLDNAITNSSLIDNGHKQSILLGFSRKF